MVWKCLFRAGKHLSEPSIPREDSRKSNMNQMKNIGNLQKPSNYSQNDENCSGMF